MYKKMRPESPQSHWVSNEVILRTIGEEVSFDIENSFIKPVFTNSMNEALLVSNLSKLPRKNLGIIYRSFWCLV